MSSKVSISCIPHFKILMQGQMNPQMTQVNIAIKSLVSLLCMYQ